MQKGTGTCPARLLSRKRGGRQGSRGTFPQHAKQSFPGKRCHTRAGKRPRGGRGSRNRGGKSSVFGGGTVGARGHCKRACLTLRPMRKEKLSLSTKVREKGGEDSCQEEEGGIRL